MIDLSKNFQRLFEHIDIETQKYYCDDIIFDLLIKEGKHFDKKYIEEALEQIFPNHNGDIDYMFAKYEDGFELEELPGHAQYTLAVSSDWHLIICDSWYEDEVVKEAFTTACELFDANVEKSDIRYIDSSECLQDWTTDPSYMEQFDKETIISNIYISPYMFDTEEYNLPDPNDYAALFNESYDEFLED